MTDLAFDRHGIEERREQRHHRGWHIISKLVSARQHADADIAQAGEVEADLAAALAEIDRLRAEGAGQAYPLCVCGGTYADHFASREAKPGGCFAPPTHAPKTEEAYDGTFCFCVQYDPVGG